MVPVAGWNVAAVRLIILGPTTLNVVWYGSVSAYMRRCICSGAKETMYRRIL